LGIGNHMVGNHISKTILKIIPRNVMTLEKKAVIYLGNNKL
jgi:hypothetical protein